MHINSSESQEQFSLESRSAEESTSEQNEKIHTRAEAIAGTGNYEEILETFRFEELMDYEVARVRESHGESLESATWMTEGDWEMLAVMDCFDKGTAHHCVETYRIAHDRIGRFTMGDKTFSEIISNEEVPLSEFYRACLFHDIGKCCIPRSILQNNLTDSEFGAQLCEDITTGDQTDLLTEIERAAGERFDGERGDTKQLKTYVSEHHIHAMRFVPAREVLSDEDLIIIAERFPEIDLRTATLADFLTPHEEESERIFVSQGFPVAAEIAGKHHNYRSLPMRYPIATGSLGVSAALEELLSLSDMEQAMSEKRSYKTILPMSQVLLGMINEVESRKLNTIITTFWISQELAEISNKEREENADCIRTIERFIANHQEEVRSFEQFGKS